MVFSRPGSMAESYEASTGGTSVKYNVWNATLADNGFGVSSKHNYDIAAKRLVEDAKSGGRIHCPMALFRQSWRACRDMLLCMLR